MAETFIIKGDNMRRIVTGHSQDGKSIILKDGEPARVLTRDEAPGVVVTEVWATHGPIPALPAADNEPTIEGWAYWPEPGASIFRIVRFPPASEIAQASEAGIRVAPAWQECLAKARDQEVPDEYKGAAMHITDTVDYAIVLSGEIWMALDEDKEVLLKSGDCVVQNGTNHAWCNKSDEPCTIAFALIGAARLK
jgi:mannose-6-phosphate isomerase-like protein (cupin superfamily)